MASPIVTKVLLGLVLPEAVPVMHLHESSAPKPIPPALMAARVASDRSGSLYGGIQGTILTSSLGTPSPAQTTRQTLLGG